MPGIQNRFPFIKAFSNSCARTNCFLTFIFFLFFYSSALKAQNYTWAKYLAGKGTSSVVNLDPGDSDCNGIETDSEGNVYIIGSYNDSVDFDMGPGQKYLAGCKQRDLFLSKYDSLGNSIWTVLFESDFSNYDSHIDMDANDNIVVTGSFYQTLSIKSHNDTTNVSTGQGVPYGFYIAKFSSSGNLQWAHCTNGAFASSICTDTDSNIYVCGSFYIPVDMDPDSANYFILNGNYSFFVCKYKANGQFVWAKSIDNAGQQSATRKIVAGPSKNIYIAGYFQNTVDFDPDAGTHFVTAQGSAFYADRFLLKLNAQGNFKWLQTLNCNSPGNNSNASTITMAVDENENIILSGDFSDTTDFDPGPGQTICMSPNTYNTFFSCYDINGNFKWAKATRGSFAIPTDIRTDCSGIYITGSFAFSVDFDPGSGFAFLNSNLTSAFPQFLAKYDLSGNYLWASMLGGGAYGGTCIESFLALHKNYQFVGGAFKQTRDFDPSPAVSSLTASGVGLNVFIARYKSDMLDTNFTQTEFYTDPLDCGNYSFVVNASQNGATYLWQDGNTSANNTLTQAGSYWLIVSKGMCVTKNTYIVNESNCFVMPNVFSPNGDGTNDFFSIPKLDGIDYLHISIYNRWGEEVFENKGENFSWDGKNKLSKACTDGTYYWVLNYKPSHTDSKSLKGFLTLVR